MTTPELPQAMPAGDTVSAPDTPPAEEGATRWVTVRQAAEAAGVSVSAIRKWYSGSNPAVPSRMEPGPSGPQRLLPLDAVLERARRGAGGSSSTGSTTPAQQSGGVLVPLAAWERMLDQLGNLHVAGQELAAARERAAKAETEAAFLRERLAELRREEPDRQFRQAALDRYIAEELRPGNRRQSRQSRQAAEEPGAEESRPPRRWWRFGG